jgi:hypothetical protein
MHDAPPPPSSNSSTGSSRLSHFLGVGLLLGMALLFSAYLWSSRESHAVQPVDVVTLRPPLHGHSANIEIVPYQHAAEPVTPPCPPTERLCLVIGPQTATPETTTFT